jgi:5-aminolevulinate synthase
VHDPDAGVRVRTRVTRPFDSERWFGERLDALRRAGAYRRFRTLERLPRAFPRVQWRRDDGTACEVVVWCSNDYLGMSHHPVAVGAAHEALERYGAGSGGTRNISGTHAPLVALEAELADLHGKGGALVFGSGYVANDTTLATLGRHLPGCTIYSDAANHASMIAGIRRSGAASVVFPHNDACALDAMLAQGDPSNPRLVAFESLYSMDGDLAPLRALVRVARAHGALIYVDETHAVGVHGPGGAGLVAAAGLTDQVDLIQGGLGKAYGAVGGFIAGSAVLVDFVRSFAPGFIFTTSLPPAVASAALASVRHLRTSERERERLWANVHRARAALERLGLAPANAGAQILPIVIGQAARCDAVSHRLLEEFGAYLQPINHPTVPRGTERLRLTPTARHDEAMIDDLERALAAVLAHQPRLRASVRPSPIGTSDRSTRSSRRSAAFNARRATVSASVTAGSATAPLHSVLSMATSPPGRSNRSTRS